MWVDPQYGTLAAFDLLVEEAHQLEMRIIIDVVVNHTSTEHPWFIESASGKEHPKRDWYILARSTKQLGKIFFVVLLGSMTRLRINIITIALPKSKQT